MEKASVDVASSVISFNIKDKLLVVESDLEDVKCTPVVTEEEEEKMKTRQQLRLEKHLRGK